MSNKIVDSHCHLNFPQFKDNLKEVVQKALDNPLIDVDISNATGA